MAQKKNGEVKTDLTPAQREAILTRDNHECQSQLRGRIHCSSQLEVDHLIPKRGARSLFDFPVPFINTPENLLTKCTTCHREHPESHHPDAHKASWDYRNGDKQAFQKMVRNREALLAEGSEYSNERHQLQDMVTAEERTKQMDGDNPGWWRWPRRNRQGN